MSTGYLLILIYTGMIIDTQPMPDMASCLAESKAKLGEKMKVTAWDNMNGANKIPHVTIAFCVQGAAE